MSPQELAQPVSGAGRARLDRLVVQVPLDVSGQPAGGFVAPGAVFLEAAHDDPVELAAHVPGQFRGVAAALGGQARAAIPCDSVKRVLGLGGSSSLIIRRSSAKAAFRSRDLSSGVVPVSSS